MCIHLFVILFFFCSLDPLLVHQPISGAEQTCITFAADTKVDASNSWFRSEDSEHTVVDSNSYQDKSQTEKVTFKVPDLQTGVHACISIHCYFMYPLLKCINYYRKKIYI